MKHDKELTILKLVAVAAATYYVFRLSQKNHTPLGNLPENMQPNADKIAHLASNLLPKDFRPAFRAHGGKIINKFLYKEGI